MTQLQLRGPVIGDAFGLSRGPLLGIGSDGINGVTRSPCGR